MRINTLNAAEMKSFNRRRILEHLRTQSTSRAELSRVTGLTRSAISLIVDGLLQDGILREGCEQGGRAGDNTIGKAGDKFSGKPGDRSDDKSGDNTGGKVGRKAVSLVMNPGAFYSIGLSISHNKYSVGIVDFGGAVQKSISRTLDPRMLPSDTLKHISKDIDDLLRKNSLPGQLLGMGITAPSPLDSRSGTILNPPNFAKWSNLPIVDFFREQIPGVVLLENTANALALAEKTFCLKGAYNSFLELVVDTGVGAGLIIEGDLYKGGSGFCNEFGHTSINLNGRRCSCGNFGCAELYASIPNLIAAAQKLDSRLDCWKSIVDLSSKGDASARAALEMEAEYLTSIIVNAVNILDVDAVVLTGEIAYHAGELNEKITGKVNERFIGRGSKKIKILASQMPEHPGTLSSANLVMENYVRIGE